jgi:hypothetical protein|tara:strand:- start:381 stop:596 length:216 start_codon:yes stop_codon:yes gene_type:complete
MSSQYKENNFSTESFSVSQTVAQNKINDPAKPNINHLMKKMLIERKKERKNIINLFILFLSIILIFCFFQK